MKFADKLIQLRKQYSMSQEELADKLDVSRQSVSKWEGEQSMPELSKIIQIAEMFNVSTDFLLKDSLDIDPANITRSTTKNIELSTIRITQQQAKEIIDNSSKQAKLYTIATALCIISPVPLMILLANSALRVFSPAVSIIIGIVALLIFVCLGVGVFIYSDYKNKQILFVDNQNIILDNVTKKYVEDAKTAYCPFHIRCIIIGTGLCIMASIPIIVFALLISDYIGVGVSITLVFVVVAVSFFIYSSTRMSAFNKLLNYGEYNEKNRKVSKIMENIAGAYWTLVTAIYLLYSFILNDWGKSWIVWPVCAVLYVVVSCVLEIFIDRKINKTIELYNKANDTSKEENDK